MCYSISCRLSVLSAITSVQQRLKLYSKGLFSHGSANHQQLMSEDIGMPEASTTVLGPK